MQDALRLGCCAVGFTTYPGSAHQLEMYGQLRTYAEEAKRNGLAVVTWSYPRGSARQVVKDTPPYDAAVSLNREREMGIHQYYGRAGYGTGEVKSGAAG